MARIDQRKIKSATLDPREYRRFLDAADKIRESKLEIYGSEYSTVFDIRSAARRAKHRHKELGLIVVDYIQLVDPQGGSSNRTRANDVSEVTRGLKLLADGMKCPVVALSQLNRMNTSRQDHRPYLSDLKESGSIEQDATTVIFVHRDAYYDANERDKVEDSPAQIIIAKQRNGRLGTAFLTWQPIFTRFSSTP